MQLYPMNDASVQVNQKASAKRFQILSLDARPGPLPGPPVDSGDSKPGRAPGKITGSMATLLTGCPDRCLRRETRPTT